MEKQTKHSPDTQLILSSFVKKATLPFVSMWVNLEVIMPSELILAQAEKPYLSHDLTCVCVRCQKVKFTETE